MDDDYGTTPNSATSALEVMVAYAYYVEPAVWLMPVDET